MLKQEKSLATEVHLNFEVLTSDPLICTMNLPSLTVSNQMEEFISKQRVNQVSREMLKKTRVEPEVFNIPQAQV